MKVGATIKIPYDEISSRRLKKLKQDLTFLNANGEVVTCYRDVISLGFIRIPRGAWYLVDDLDYVDERSRPEMPELDFALTLDDVEKDERFVGQSDAVNAIFKHEQGQIIRPPGTGKTQILLNFIARSKTRCLVLVHTKDILNQWVEYAEAAIPDIEIGVIQGKRLEVEHLTIATVQTIKQFCPPGQANRKFWRQFGAVIADEGHHGAAKTWEHIINVSPAFYRISATASATRADGMHPALKFLFGQVIHRQEFSSSVELKVIPVKTKFYAPYRGSWDWTNLVNRLVTDDERNRQIAEVADAEVERGNSVLVLSRRIEHLERIADGMRSTNTILTGRRKDSEREEILEGFRNGTVGVVLATQLADEAIDVPRLNRVLLTHPGKHEGRLVQQIGRALREFPDKDDALIYDFYDPRVSVLWRQWGQRRRAYKKNRIKIQSSRRLAWR